MYRSRTDTQLPLPFLHFRRESAVPFALAFLSLIPAANLLLSLYLPFWLSFTQETCYSALMSGILWIATNPVTTSAVI